VNNFYRYLIIINTSKYMSAFLSALGQYASPLLATAGGYILNKAKPLLGRVGSWISGMG
jgi:drug/metabolite transporter (DMT)-like permease